MEVQFLGGADEIGRSAVLVDDSLLLDYGMASESPPQYPVGDVDPDAVVVSHGHLDHVGAVPALMSSGDLPPVHWTPPTRDLATTLAEDTLKLHGSTPRCPFTDTDVRRLTQASVTHGYGESFEAAGYEVTLYNAGHIPGSAHVLVDDGDTRLLYTGDFHTGDQRLVAPSTARPEADAVICESTYSDVTHEARDAVERRFAESIQQTVWQGGTVVVPAFAIGRTQEAMLVCAAHDVDCYVDGMGQRVTTQLKRHPEFLRDADALAGATSSARFVDGRDGQRKRIAKQNTVIITTSGMLSGGPAMTYVPAIRQHPTNKVALTGYQVEGTPGRELLETGSAELDGRVMPVSAQVELHQFSAHADRDGLLEFLDSYRETPVLINHGDRTAAFAEELRADGFTASAPALGEAVGL
ncbi:MULTISPECIES: MBL fold metallo-hydrolase [Haloarcula]|uniref:MBL fold metallo-hydrolase n=1 Tax=Haloarcula pellucida TaxID=1427151 RepID=A0A830GQS5_9EURY|nr:MULTISPECIES: MBL fold metallo-hydrolase [Halomicroarcula]MBX0349188.1 MBL fold metallo-hydrolase [Halomicroarcula pellucida]MDS0279220.1 MBL fold metallo-hydrolase [Halomicroarcula sp. S1AR25-4]GGN99422.1 MBL fold metallo-hydrolase [Halomicroarcula pellucida]